MAATKQPVITELQGAQVSPDGSYTEMTVKRSDGSIQILRFEPRIFLNLLTKVFELFLNQKLQKEKAEGLVHTQPLHVSTSMAQESVGGKAVIVLFRLSSGLPAEFALSPQEAEELHKQLGQAVDRARQQSSQSRH